MRTIDQIQVIERLQEIPHQVSCRYPLLALYEVLNLLRDGLNRAPIVT